MGGIKLKAKEGYKILIQGTDIELENIYVRTRYLREISGRELEVQCNVYYSRGTYEEDINKTLGVTLKNTLTLETLNLPSIINIGKVTILEDNIYSDLELSHLATRDFLSIQLEEEEI